MKKESRSKRNYNLDLLRIVSMLMIITLHYCNFGYHVPVGGSIGDRTPILWLIYTFCYVAVNLYVLISGYFLCKSTFKWKKVLKLVIEVLFYSIAIGLIFYIFKLHHFTTLRDLLMNIMPISSNAYWFISVYLILYVLSPFLNKFINSLTKKEHRNFLIITGIILFIINNLVPGTNVVDATRGYGIIWFMYLYIFAAYIRLYDLFKIKIRFYLIFYILFSISTFAYRYICIKYLSSIDIFKGNHGILHAYNSITIFAASVCLFMFFKNMNIKERMPRLVEKFAVATFGVYLIHENYLVREILYDKILRVSYYATKSFGYKAFAMIISVLAVFYVCSCIEMLRKFIFDKIEN